jgi:hypothetical protein
MKENRLGFRFRLKRKHVHAHIGGSSGTVYKEEVVIAIRFLTEATFSEELFYFSMGSA